MELSKGKKGLWEVGRIIADIDEIDRRQEWEVADMGCLPRSTNTDEGIRWDWLHLVQEVGIVCDMV